MHKLIKAGLNIKTQETCYVLVGSVPVWLSKIEEFIKILFLKKILILKADVVLDPTFKRPKVLEQQKTRQLQ